VFPDWFPHVAILSRNPGDWKVAQTGRQECLPYILRACFLKIKVGNKIAMRLRSDHSNTLVTGLHSRDQLPHLKREGGAYFVTFRLAGTLPGAVLLQFKQERANIIRQAESARRPLTWHEQEELFYWYAERVDKYLDAGHGNCFLGRPEIAELVSSALRFFAGTRYDLLAWVVMPNHVHVVVHPLYGWTLSQVLKSWKGYTAREANRLLGRTGQTFWQVESYDHLVRDDEDRQRCCHYASMNPVNAGLCTAQEDWPWSSVYRVRA
jgi:REP element-mobilizing transposase RayT